VWHVTVIGWLGTSGSSVRHLPFVKAKKGPLNVQERKFYMEMNNQEDARAFMTFCGRLMEIQAMFARLLAEGRPGESVPEDMLFRDYWTHNEIAALFRSACKAAGVSYLDSATMDSVSHDQGLLQIRQDLLQTNLKRACDLLNVPEEGRNQLGLYDN